jgi:hypothetical protein
MIRTVVRWSGLLLTIGAALLAIAFVMLPFAPSGALPPLISVPILLSSILLLLSLPGMYAKQSSAAGWTGLVGHALLQTGMLLFVVALSPGLRYPSYNPPGGENAMDFILAVALALGLLLTAVATIRAGVFPRWAGILLLIGAGGFIFGFFIAELLPSIAGVLGITLMGIPLGFAWAGVAMLQVRSLPSAAQAAVA